jgi:serine/threonine protein kinase
VEILSRLRHQNIVILMGCCPEDFCLVYEYCAHGSLEDRLKDEARALPWYTRLRIALEVKHSVSYLIVYSILEDVQSCGRKAVHRSSFARLRRSRTVPDLDTRS